METEILTHLKAWITHISTPMDDLGGLPVCPYAQGIEYEVKQVGINDVCAPLGIFGLIIYVLPDSVSLDQLKTACKKYNESRPELIFLADSRCRETFINGVKTNNGRFNLILCQHRSELDHARSKLRKTNYYQYWTDEYIKEILST